MKLVSICMALAPFLCAADADLIVSHHARAGFELSADPDSKAWKGVKGVFADHGPQGQAAAGHRTEIRSRWTDSDIYFLFLCPYDTLYLKPDPSTTTETNHLWDWDVAEVFIGSDFQHIRHYYEFEVSPQSEWVDLDINRDFAEPDGGIHWDSKFASKARIDRDRKIWYAEMRIPFAAIDKRKPAEGLEFRVNLYRCQGPPPDRVYISWRPTGKRTFHVPEAFGRLKLE